MYLGGLLNLQSYYSFNLKEPVVPVCILPRCCSLLILLNFVCPVYTFLLVVTYDWGVAESVTFMVILDVCFFSLAFIISIVKTQ